MQRDHTVRNLNLKERERLEIQRQIEDFLRSGGRIRVFDAPVARSAAVLGIAWRDHDEAIELLN